MTPTARSLSAYEVKRDFRKTPEPRGKASARSRGKTRGLLFCVQKHLASQLHYDFRLEHRGVLLSWAVPKGPSLDPAQKRLAMMVEDHPLDYGSFEGIIPEGYGAGIVLLWDTGTWTPHPDFADIDLALRKGELKFELEGYKLKGSWVLVRTGRPPHGDSRQWLLIKHRDSWSGPLDVAEVAPLSVKSGRAFAEILAEAGDEMAIWRSNRPARGGATGQMLADIIEEAARIRLARSRPVKKAARPAKKKTTKRGRGVGSKARGRGEARSRGKSRTSGRR